MSEWWTYRPSDFLLFSPRTYERLFELHNLELWPAHVVTLAIGVALLLLPRSASPLRVRLLLIALAALWALVAWAFHHRRYATINWAADYFAIAFVIEAAALAAAAIIGVRATTAVRSTAELAIGRAIVLAALVGYPLIAALARGGVRYAQVFGLAPDPTAIGTLGALVLMRHVARTPLAIVPVAWCITSALLLWAMASLETVVPAAAVLIALAAMARARRDRAPGVEPGTARR